MNNELKMMLTALEKLNNYANKEIMSADDFNVEIQRIQDLSASDRELLDLINELDEIDFFSPEQKMQKLCLLYVSMAAYISDLEQIREVIEKFIGLYREKVFWKGINYE